ncbi:zinc finger protein 839 [Mantella aurantiaca]
MAAPSGHDKMAAAAEYMQVVVGGDLQPGQQVVVLQGEAGEEMRAADISPELLQTIAGSDTVYYLQADGSLVPGGTLAEVTGGEGTIGAPVMMDAALQLKNVADHVALKQGPPTQTTRIPNQKQVKSICVQVPGLKHKEDIQSANTAEDSSTPVNMSADDASVVATQVKAAKAEPPPAQVRSRPARAITPDPSEGVDSAEEHGCCVAHRQYGSCAPGSAKRGQKRKKPVKIKTRSGRISRPPKHKAKDYKFLKVGDSIQDSSVDSEDSSEVSSEEEDDGGKMRAPRDSGQPHTVRNSLFQCQTCEKSYMGKGGLFRHYRLYPVHGQMDPSFVLEAKKSGDVGTGEHKKPIPRPRKRLLEDPAKPGVSSQQTLARDGLEMVRTPCRGRRQMTARRFGRPRKLLRNGTVEEHAITVKELIQQCEEKDLKEQVAPSFTKLLSVYDFLLLKVKQEHVDSKPLFPYVYREFEKLHSMLKNLAEEYVINMDQNVEKPLEVTDCKVAESLGISKEMTVTAAPSSSSVTFGQETQIGENEDESSDEELMPPAKRLKISGEGSKDAAEDMSAGIGGAVQRGGLGEHNSPLILHSAADPGTEGDALEQEAAASNDLEVEVAESLQAQTEAAIKYDSQESLSSSQSTDASQDHPLNLSCQFTEEILSLQTRVLQKEATEAEPSADLLPACDLQAETACDLQAETACDLQAETACDLQAETACDLQAETACDLQAETADPGIPCLASMDCSQVGDLSRTVVTTSVPTTIAEAMCREASQVSFVEVGGTLIPTTSAFSTSLNVGGVTPAFSLNHGQELVFIHSTEETATEEAVVIFDNTGGAETHLDTVVALVEM